MHFLLVFQYFAEFTFPSKGSPKCYQNWTNPIKIRFKHYLMLCCFKHSDYLCFKPAWVPKTKKLTPSGLLPNEPFGLHAELKIYYSNFVWPISVYKMVCHDLGASKTKEQIRIQVKSWPVLTGGD